MNFTIHQECGSVVATGSPSCPECGVRLPARQRSAPPAPRQRVGDAERDRTVTALTTHFTAGRLSQQEFEHRSGLALAAKFATDLKILLADLPTIQEPQPPAEQEEEEADHSVAIFAVVMCAIALAAFLAWGLLFHGFSSGTPDYNNYTQQPFTAPVVTQDIGRYAPKPNGGQMMCTWHRAEIAYVLIEGGWRITCVPGNPEPHWIAVMG